MGAIQQDPLVLSRDGTFSANIDGISFWTFNDTTLSQDNASGQNFFSNSLAWTTNLHASGGITLDQNLLDRSGAPTTYLPFTPAEAAFNTAHDPNNCSLQTDPLCGQDYALWGGPILNTASNGKVFETYALVQRGGSIQGFNVLGVGIAQVDLKTLTITRPTVTPGTANPTLLWQGSEVGYGGASYVEDGYVLLVGCAADFLSEDCKLAAVPEGQVEQKSAYYYYAGNNTWSHDENKAVTLFQGGPAGNTLFFDKALGQYVVVYSALFSNNVYARTAPEPWGPWSDQILLFAGTQGDQQDLIYAALAHPEFEEKNGLVEYITYVQTTGFLRQNVQLVKVELSEPSQAVPAHVPIGSKLRAALR